MHSVRLEAIEPDGATIEATIPLGRPASRRAGLITAGWAVEQASSGTRHYTRRFNAGADAPTEIVSAVDEAHRTLHGSRAKDVRWSLGVRSMYRDDARNPGEVTRWDRRSVGRRRGATALVMGAMGLWVSERVSSDQARNLTALDPPLTAAIVIGGTTLAVLVYLSGVPSRISHRFEEVAETWIGRGGRFAIEASYSVAAALIWSFALALLFRPPR